MSNLLWAVQNGYATHIHRYEELLASSQTPPSLDPAGAAGVRRPLLEASALTAGPARPGATDQSVGTVVAVIPLVGLMSKYDSWWYYGTQRVVSAIQQADADPAVAAIVLYVDSPGGQVDGTEALALAIALCAKPVVAYVDGLCCSGAYWAASQADQIIINSGSTAILGSIGVLYTYTNIQKALEMSGIERQLIRAGSSPDKQLANSFEPLTDVGLAEIQQMLDAAKGSFDAAIVQGRGERLTAAGRAEGMSGRVFTGSRAIELGLADSVGTLQDAIASASKLQAASASGASASHLPNPIAMTDPATPAAEAAENPAVALTTPPPAVQEEPALEADPFAPTGSAAAFAALEQRFATMQTTLDRLAGLVNSLPTPGVQAGGDAAAAPATTAKNYPWQEKAMAVWNGRPTAE